MRSAQSLPLSATRALSGYRDVTQLVANGARHDRRILADPEYERRLPGAEEVNADEVQAGHGGAGTVRRERKPELVKGRQPDPARIVRAKAGGKDDGTEISQGDLERRVGVKRRGLRQIGDGDALGWRRGLHHAADVANP